MIVGVLQYQCERCDMKVSVGMAIGVVPPADDYEGSVVPAPEKIECSYCGAEMEYIEGSYSPVVSSDMSYRYLRVPSRRAGAEMVRDGRFEAQLVVGG